MCPKYVPTHVDVSMAQREYLRVPLTKRLDGVQQPMLRRSATDEVRPREVTVWIVQLSHIKTGRPGEPSNLGLNAMMFGAARQT